MTKIIAYNVRNEDIPLIKKWSEDNRVEVKMIEEQLTIDNVSLAKGFDGLTTSQNQMVPNEIYKKLNEYQIKQIAQRSTGYDYYDLDAATRNNIIISNVPVYSPESIAEFTITQVLMLIRKVRDVAEKQKERDFRWQPAIQAKLLGEMTIGIIGTGDIGLQTAKLFHCFGAKVLGYDIYPNEEATKYLEYLDSFEDVIKKSDIVSLHMPGTDNNYHQFDYETFQLFKPTAYFINNARGSIVDTAGLIRALDDGLISGAALDTYEGEGKYIPFDNRETGIHDELFLEVLNHPKILFSPHIAHYTNVAVRNIMNISLDSTLEVIKTGDTKNRVNTKQ